MRQAAEDVCALNLLREHLNEEDKFRNGRDAAERKTFGSERVPYVDRPPRKMINM